MIDKESETIKFKRFLEKNRKGTIKVEFDENNIKSEYLSQLNSEVFNTPKENKIMNLFFGSEWRKKGFLGLFAVLIVIVAFFMSTNVKKWIEYLFNYFF